MVRIHEGRLRYIFLTARPNYHRLERERIHLLLIADAQRGLADIEAGRTVGADAAIAQLQQRRAAGDSTKTGKTARKRG